MKKIISLFKRDYEGDRLVYNEVVEGAEWVIAGEGVATVKYDGTCCDVRNGLLFKRYDRKLIKKYMRRLNRGWKSYIPRINHYKSAPYGWVAAEKFPNQYTGHWPGWLLVRDHKPEDEWHREAMNPFLIEGSYALDLENGTYELVGAKVQGNPYGLDNHQLWKHGLRILDDWVVPPERTFQCIKEWLEYYYCIEGIVWHHRDGRMVKIKRRDFGFDWPAKIEFKRQRVELLADTILYWNHYDKKTISLGDNESSHSL